MDTNANQEPVKKPNLMFGKQGAPSNATATTAAAAPRSNNDSPQGDQVVEESAPVDDRIVYSSHPIMRFAIGKYEFTNGQLKLPRGKESDRFERLLDQLPPHIRRQVVKLDSSAADRLVANLQSKVVTGIDSTAGSTGPSANPQA